MGAFDYQKEYDALNGITRGRGGVILNDPTAKRGGQSGVRYPMDGGPAYPTQARAQPATTTNAVENVGVDQPAYPTQFRAGFEAGSAKPPAAPSSSSAGPAKRDESQPYPLDLTNAVGPGVRAATMQYPTFNAPPQAVRQGAAAVGGGAGLISPNVQYELDDMLSEGKKFLGSRGIVDRLRGRTLLKQRARLLEGATDIARTRVAGISAETGIQNANANTLQAQTGAYRATNEVPLALLDSSTRRYGVDSVAASRSADRETERYGIDTRSADARDATRAGLAPHLPMMQRQDAINRLFADPSTREDAADLATIGTRERPDQRPTMTPSPDGTTVMVMRPGATKPEAFSIADLTRAAAEDARKKRENDLRK